MRLTDLYWLTQDPLQLWHGDDSVGAMWSTVDVREVSQVSYRPGHEVVQLPGQSSPAASA